MKCLDKWFQEDGLNFLKDIGVSEGHTLLDFGCGEGNYTIPAAKIAGNEGVVYAVDKTPASLEIVERTAKTEGIENIVTVHDNSEVLNINLKDNSLDVILLYDVLHYIDKVNRKTIHKNAYKLLKPGAILSVFPKHRKADMPMWNLNEIDLEDIIKEIETSGFHLEQTFSKILIHDDMYDEGYIINFRKPF
jgi:ubiquinone/menaquinone biosynthesis C-methylase UbiE